MTIQGPWYTRPRVLVALALGLVLAGSVAYGTVQLTSGGNHDTSPPAAAPAAPSPAEDWQSAAQQFAVAFTNTAGGKQAWFARIKPLVSPSLAQGFSYTAMSNVPQAHFERITGGREEAGETPTRSAQLHYTDGLVVDITLGQIPKTGHWVVTTVTPHEEPDNDVPEDRV